MAITVIGQESARWAERLPQSLDAVLAELAQAPSALAFAAALKSQGRPVVGSLHVPDRRSVTALNVAGRLLENHARFDDRRELFLSLANEQLTINGTPQSELMTYDATVKQIALDFLRVCDIVLVRSHAERARLTELGGTFTEMVVPVGLLDQRVPYPPSGFKPRQGHGGIVVWAPALMPQTCALFAMALEESRIPVTIVAATANAPDFGLRAKFVDPTHSAEALEQALAIVDASTHDPGTALALAHWGIPLAVARSSGAHEWLPGVFPYDTFDFRSIFEATFTALGGGAPFRVGPSDGLATLDAALKRVSAVPRVGPLVSVVVPTNGELEKTRKTLEMLGTQTYRNLEVLVVGEPNAAIEQMLGNFPPAKLVPPQCGAAPCAALNSGVVVANGEYVTLLLDDYIYYPDHIARLVCALERTGEIVANGLELAIHYRAAQSGKDQLVGHKVGSKAVRPSEMMVVNHIGGPGIMIRRSAFLTDGYFDPDLGEAADFEMWMRLAEKYNFVHVNRVTSGVGMHDAAQADPPLPNDTPRLLRAIYDVHPVDDRLTQAERIAFERTIAGAEMPLSVIDAVTHETGLDQAIIV